MRVCTLIVRLVGLALLLYSARIVVEVHLLGKQVIGMMNGFFGSGMPQNPIGSAVPEAWQRMFWYGVAGMVIGAVMAIFAPWVARILTYDAPDERVL